MKRSLLSISFLFCLFSFSMAQTQLWNNPSSPAMHGTDGIAFSSDGLRILSSSECDSAHIRLWDTQTGALTWDWPAPVTLQCLLAAKLSGNGHYFGSIEETGQLIVFDYSTPTPTLMYTIDIGSGGSYSLDFSPDNTKVAIDGDDDSIYIYEVASGARYLPLGKHDGSIHSVSYSPDGSMLASGGFDNLIKIWNPNTGALLHTLTGHTMPVYSARFTRDGVYLISSGNAGTSGEIKVWSTANWNCINTITLPSTVLQVDASYNSAYIIAGCSHTTRLYQLLATTPMASFNTSENATVNCVAFSPVDFNVVSGTTAGEVVYWNMNNVIGINEINLQALDFEVYPNPAKDRISLQLNSQVNDFKTAIYDQQGRLVQQTDASPDHQNLDISGLETGMYLLKVYNSDHLGVRSFVKL